MAREGGTPPALPILVAGGFTLGKLLHTVTEDALKRFQKRGYRVTIVPFSMDDMTDVQTYAGHIATESRVLADAHGGRINVVGLSMGGVAALFGIKHLELAPVCATFTSVGSPYHGSRLSHLADPTRMLAPLRLLGLPLDVSRIGYQLRVGSKFLENLHRAPLPAGLQAVSIAGEHDYVCPPRTALLAGTVQRTLKFSHHDVIRSEWLLEEAFSHCI
jgi:hypothetical protein